MRARSTFFCVSVHCNITSHLDCLGGTGGTKRKKESLLSGSVIWEAYYIYACSGMGEMSCHVSADSPEVVANRKPSRVGEWNDGRGVLGYGTVARVEKINQSMKTAMLTWVACMCDLDFVSLSRAHRYVCPCPCELLSTACPSIYLLPRRTDGLVLKELSHGRPQPLGTHAICLQHQQIPRW